MVKLFGIGIFVSGQEYEKARLSAAAGTTINECLMTLRQCQVQLGSQHSCIMHKSLESVGIIIKINLRFHHNQSSKILLASSS